MQSHLTHERLAVEGALQTQCVGGRIKNSSADEHVGQNDAKWTRPLPTHTHTHTQLFILLLPIVWLFLILVISLLTRT